MSKTVVVLSGGMDSATLLAKMVADGHEVAALSVNYAQRHKKELGCAAALCTHYGVPHTIVDLSALSVVMKGSSQTDPTVKVPEGHYEEPSMKHTVVPNRNMLLIGTAAAHAISLGYDSITYGAHAGDHAIYPDCRQEFIEAMRGALALCDYQPLELSAPFVEMDKGDIAVLGGELNVPYQLTWTCYNGRELSCGKCGACQERIEAFAKAFKVNGTTDPLVYEQPGDDAGGEPEEEWFGVILNRATTEYAAKFAELAPVRAACQTALDTGARVKPKKMYLTDEEAARYGLTDKGA